MFLLLFSKHEHNPHVIQCGAVWGIFEDGIVLNYNEIILSFTL